ncbi:hypothetical protein [Aestuariibaculum suncheonense]|uniref:Uncharacterized protein n=1 Tax=Aestuariibaculum suncheonense TaxID=1028745 RepID=A0A8J6QMB2_9FLAO|nr:hypothetical protein [Aestuariibaculum suncheonense]MBD0836721.1 hypothetical protein [Aestuariibaculum suncheonense]
MSLKILKILTVISFLLITWSGPHIGGPFGLYLILGLLGNISSIIQAGVILVILILFLYSSYKSFHKYDLYLFLVGGVILMIPICSHINTVFTHYKNKGDNVFFLTLIPFLLLYGITLLKIYKQKMKFNSNDNKI